MLMELTVQNKDPYNIVYHITELIKHDKVHSKMDLPG
jgi:hypothetical protein